VNRNQNRKGKHIMITATVYSDDPRSACLYRNGLRIAGVVFVGNGEIPPVQRAQLLNGFKTLKQAREFCAQMGLAWFRTAQG
jgi:hypothetical protein